MRFLYLSRNVLKIGLRGTDLFQNVKTQIFHDFPSIFPIFINFHDFCVQKINDFIARMGTTHNQGHMLVFRTLVHILYSLVGTDCARSQ